MDTVQIEISRVVNPGQGGEADPAVTIGEAQRDLLGFMEKEGIDKELLLKGLTGESPASICRLPASLVEINPKAYHPQVVSIGPYHHGKEHLRPFEEFKWVQLNSMLSRTQRYGIGLGDYLSAIKPLEKAARACYSETIDFNSDDFVRMMVLDGCFIVQLFRKQEGGGLGYDEVDVKLFTARNRRFGTDIFLLENQLPFFILQRLFDISKEPGNHHIPSLAMLSLQFRTANAAAPEGFRSLTGMHLLDVCRHPCISPNMEELSWERQCMEFRKGDKQPTDVQSATKLQTAGIKFRPKINCSFLDIQFAEGLLEIPTINVNLNFMTFVQNCVAFEQSYMNGYRGMHFTAYAFFMKCLIKTPKDVTLLCDKKIIANNLGSHDEIVHLFNDPYNELVFFPEYCYLHNQIRQVQDYSRNDWRVWWTSFKDTYFSTTWSLIATLAAASLLLLTVAQTIFTILGYVRPPS